MTGDGTAASLYDGELILSLLIQDIVQGSEMLFDVLNLSGGATKPLPRSYIERCIIIRRFCIIIMRCRRSIIIMRWRFIII